MHQAIGTTATQAISRESWLLIFNCQVLGLANSLNLLTDEVRVEHYDPAGFRNNSDDVLRRWDAYDRVLVAPQLLSLLPDEFAGSEKIWKIPTISFNAYHPDICHLRSEGKAFKGPLGDYHSCLAYAAFQLGLSVDEACRLYNETTYAQLGYLDRWNAAKKQLLDSFAEEGLDLRLQFANWSRNGAFMYSGNHVRIHCLVDVAKAILGRAGKKVAYETAIPHDNLMNGPVFPIYPEIGAQLGVQGNYLFKIGGKYEFIRLPEFLAESFDLYSRQPEVAVFAQHAHLVDRALGFVGSRK